MRCVFPAFIVSWILLSISVSEPAGAQDDLVAKAQKERELNVYSSALVGQFDKFTDLSSVVIDSSKPNTQEPRAKR